MQSVSPEFIKLCKKIARRPITIVEVMWDDANWTSEWSYTIEHSGSLSVAKPGDELIPPGEMGRASVTLHNSTGRFSWLNEDGELYAYIGGVFGLFNKKVRIKQGFYADVGYSTVTIFTGIIFNWQESGDTVILDLRDRGAELVQDKRSTLVLQDKRADEVIRAYATLAGISDSDMDLDVATEIIPNSWLDDESLLEEIWEVARGVGGQAYFDQLGILRFETSSNWVPKTVCWNFDEDDYTNVRPDYAPDELLTKVVVEWSSRYRGQVAEVYSLVEPKLIRPGETLQFEARFSNPVYAYTGLESTDYVVLGGNAIITLPEDRRAAQRCQVVVENTHTTLSSTLYTLKIRGYALMGGPNEQSVELSTNPPGVPNPDPVQLGIERMRSSRANMYVQTITLARALAGILLERNRSLTPTWVIEGVPGIPQLEPGDRVGFQDKHHISTNREGFIVGISWSCSATAGFTQQLTLLDASRLYPYKNYYIIGVTKLGPVGRLWH